MGFVLSSSLMTVGKRFFNSSFVTSGILSDLGKIRGMMLRVLSSLKAKMHWQCNLGTTIAVVFAVLSFTDIVIGKVPRMSVDVPDTPCKLNGGFGCNAFATWSSGVDVSLAATSALMRVHIDPVSSRALTCSLTSPNSSQIDSCGVSPTVPVTLEVEEVICCWLDSSASASLSSFWRVYAFMCLFLVRQNSSV